MRSWLRPSLRYGSVSTIPFARSADASAAASTASAKSIVADHAGALLRAGHEWRRVGRLLGPLVQPGRGVRGPRDSPVQAALAQQPVHLVGQQDQGGQRRRVVGLLQPGVADRDRQREELRYVPAAGREVLRPDQGGGRHQRDPQAAVGAEAFLRREVVHVELARLDRQAARAAGRVDQHQRAGISARHPADRHGHAGGRLVVGERVGVHARLGPGLRVRARRGLDHRRCVQPRRGGRHLGELRGELAERQVLRSVLDQAECRDLPEGGGTAVAQYDLVAVRQVEQARPGPPGSAGPARGPGPGDARCPAAPRPARPARSAAPAGPWTGRSRTCRRPAAAGRDGDIRGRPPGASRDGGRGPFVRHPCPGPRRRPARPRPTGPSGRCSARSAGPAARCASAPGCARPSRPCARR